MSEMIAEYDKFKRLHADFNNGNSDAQRDLQWMFQPDAKGVMKLMLFWAASCLNFGSKCRTKCQKKFEQVLVPEWRSPENCKSFAERLEAMGIEKSGEYKSRSDETRDKKLLYIKDDATVLMRAGRNNMVFLPLFEGWFNEALKFADEVYPSGILSTAMVSMHTRALGGQVKINEAKSLREMLGDIKPERQTVTHRLKGDSLSAQNLARGEEPHTAANVKMQKLAEAYGMGRTAIAELDEREIAMAPDLGMPYTNGAMDAMAYTLKNHKVKEYFTMSKTTDFIESVKGVFGNVLRMQRGRAAVHAAKRVIFAAFPIKWGILARVTGKAKKVEDHPLTDVAVALAFHGAASALLSDQKKRGKYLKFTEEMVAASVANAGLKMVPIEEMLDKVMNGALDSEAVGKLKAMLQDSEE